MRSTRRSILLFVLTALATGGCGSEPSSETAGVLPTGPGGKADQSGELSILGDEGTLRLDEIPLALDERSPLRESDQIDLRDVAAKLDETFGSDVLSALEDREPTEADVYRAMMFASAHETEVRDEVAVFNGVEWTEDDLRAAYALAWLDASEDLRVSVGNGEDDLNAAVFHAVFTQLLSQGHTVVRGRSDTAGAVFTGFEIKGAPRDEGATGPRPIDRDVAESIVRGPVVDAAAYFAVFASIETLTGFASESYVLATDEDGDLIGGYWAAPNDSFPPLRPTRLWIAPERPEGGLVDFDLLGELAAAFDEAVPGAIGDIYEYVGEPVAFTENRFYCASVAMRIEDRFRVGDITVRAAFSDADGDRLSRDLEIKLYHAPAGNGPSLVTLAEDHRDETGEWRTDAFHFDGSDSATSPWELRVCDTTWSRGDEDTITGFVDTFEIEFHAVD